MCVAGRQLLYAFAAENGVMVRRYGKLLVATSEAERPRLEAIMMTARQNGVDDLRPMTKDDVRVLEPELRRSLPLALDGCDRQSRPDGGAGGTRRHSWRNDRAGHHGH